MRIKKYLDSAYPRSALGFLSEGASMLGIGVVFLIDVKMQIKGYFQIEARK